MRFSVGLSAILVAAGVAAACAAEAPPAREKFDLYLLMGQSNMAGRGKIEPQDRLPHPRVFKFTKEMTWAPAVDPLHFDKPVAGVGLGSTFGRVMADAEPEVFIGLIPTAVGGTPLMRWEKGGDLYQKAVVRAHAAMKHGALRGVLWHQGESDAGSPQTQSTYAARLERMIADLRRDLDAPNVPFVAGELGIFGDPEQKGNAAKLAINQQLGSLVGKVNNYAVVSSRDLKHKGDGTHFDAASLRTFGRRYAEAMQKLQAADQPNRP